MFVMFCCNRYAMSSLSLFAVFHIILWAYKGHSISWYFLPLQLQLRINYFLFLFCFIRLSGSDITPMVARVLSQPSHRLKAHSKKLLSSDQKNKCLSLLFGRDADVKVQNSDCFDGWTTWKMRFAFVLPKRTTLSSRSSVEIVVQGGGTATIVNLRVILNCVHSRPVSSDCVPHFFFLPMALNHVSSLLLLLAGTK